MQEDFSTLSRIITSRRTIKPQQMNGKKIDNAVVEQLIGLADWAPTHGRTEPWRFYIFGGEKVAAFCKDHADMKRKAQADFSEDAWQKLSEMGALASHVLLIVMRRGDLPKIPVLEEVAATAAAVQNLLLGAESLGIAAYWGTGGSVLQPEMKAYLHLRPEDQVLGALYLGYSDAPVKEGLRNTPLADKMMWM
ncbi:MAG TPA: nitroreductase [Chitinophagaceae bacterium]|nr:nitroreductase [Chitinophagaceae bacterium]